MKCQDFFSLKNKKKKLECRLLQILLGALRVNCVLIRNDVYYNKYFHREIWKKYHIYSKFLDSQA